MEDPVLAVITQVEVDLETLVQPIPVPATQVAPGPLDSGYATWVGIETNLLGYKDGGGHATATLDSVKLLLTKLYQIDFVKAIGTTLPALLDEVRVILLDIADRLGTLGPIDPSALAGIKTFLMAIQKLPGSPQALGEASDVLTQIIGLLGDVPSARLELYMIAQQIKVFSTTFSNPAI